MVASRGWLRITEASIAIIIILSAMLLIAGRRGTSTNEELSAILPAILEEIAKNSSLREIVVGNPLQGKIEIENFLSRRIKNPSFSYETRICEPDEICGLEQYPEGAKEIYSEERIISSTLYTYNPKKIKLFLWIKSN